MDTKTIFFFGDSVCSGQFISPHLTWVSRISEWAAKKSILVQNPSINGDITRNAILRMPHDIQEHEVDILYVQFGLNDCNYWKSDYGVQRVAAHSFEGNMYEIVSRAKSSGVKIVILGTNHPVEKLIDNVNYNNIIRWVVSSTGSILVDNESYWKGKPKGVLPDGVHLNKIGHDYYYNNVLPCLKEVVG